MGNVSVTPTEWGNAGNVQRTYGTLTLSSSYALGGDSFTARNFGLGTIQTLTVLPVQGFFFEPDVSNLKIKAFTNRPKNIATFGQALSLYSGSAAARSVYIPALPSSAVGVPGGMHPRIIQLQMTAAANCNAQIATSLSSVTVPVIGTTGTGGLQALYTTTGGVFYTTATAQPTNYGSIVLSDGSTIPVTVAASAAGDMALYVTTGTVAASVPLIYPTAASFTVSMSSALSLAPPNISGSSTSSQQPEVPSGTDLSSFTARWIATGW